MKLADYKSIKQRSKHNVSNVLPVLGGGALQRHGDVFVNARPYDPDWLW